MSFGIPHLTKITLDNLETLGAGAGVLGTSSGGSPRLGRLRLQTLFEDDAYPDSAGLADPRDLPPDTIVASVGGVGAPAINIEKFAGGDGEVQSLRAIEEFSGETVDVLVPGEIGGANSIASLYMAAMIDLPVVDANGMGWAFPELQMDMFFIYGTPMNYAVTTDEHGNQVAYRDIDLAKRLKDLTRVITVQMGGHSGYASPLMADAFISEYAASRTVSFATGLGRAVGRARGASTDPIDAGRELLGSEELFVGKVVDVHHRNRDGFALRSVAPAGLDEDATLEIEFQNEFLIARDDDGGLRTTVPDLICLVDTDISAPVTVDALRYGQRVRILDVPTSELPMTPEAFDVIDPEAFGYEVPYGPLPRDETEW